jgi:prepilin-type N-terminal cleavage/methylation domain-containing protein
MGIHTRGFTLLELIVVLGLTSVLLTLGVFGYAALRERLGLAAAARQVASDLALARIRAISRNREQRLLFTPGAATYSSQERTAGGFESIGSAQSLPARVRIDDCTAPDNAVSFRPRGGAGSFGTIVLVNASGETCSVSVSITGRARIQ